MILDDIKNRSEKIYENRKEKEEAAELKRKKDNENYKKDIRSLYEKLKPIDGGIVEFRKYEYDYPNDYKLKVSLEILYNPTRVKLKYKGYFLTHDEVLICQEVRSSKMCAYAKYGSRFESGVYSLEGLYKAIIERLSLDNFHKD